MQFELDRHTEQFHPSQVRLLVLLMLIKAYWMGEEVLVKDKIPTILKSLGTGVVVKENV